MGEGIVQVLVPQIGVGIKVDDMDIRISLCNSPEGSQRYQMFPAQQEGQLSSVQNFLGAFLNLV